MSAMILLQAIVLTKARRAAVSMVIKGSIRVWVLPQNLCVSCFYYPNIFMFMQLQCIMFYTLTRGDYCNRNTANPKYSPGPLVASVQVNVDYTTTCCLGSSLFCFFCWENIDKIILHMYTLA